MESGNRIRIGLQMGFTDPFWVELSEIIWQMAAAPDRYRPGWMPAVNDGAPSPAIEIVEVEMRRRHWTGDDQMAKIEEILALELDALITVPGSATVVHRLLNAGLPIISLIDYQIDHPLYTAPKGMYDAAQMACRYIAEQLHGRGRVVVVGGLVEGFFETGLSRVQGALDCFADFPAIDPIHIPASWRDTEARDTLLEELPRVDAPIHGIFGLSDTLALAAQDVGAQLGLLTNRTVLAGINGDPLAIAAITEGSMSATVATPAREMAISALGLACRAAEGEHLPDSFSYRSQLVTAANVTPFVQEKLLAIADMPTRFVGANRRLEEERLTQLETSLAINRRIGSILDRAALPHQIADLIRTNYDYDHVQIFLWDDRRRELILDQPWLDQDERIAVKLADSAALGQALLRKRPIFVPDMHNSQRFAPDPYWPETRARVVLPLRIGDRTVGVLDLHRHSLMPQGQPDLAGLQSLADQLGVAIRNAELYADALDARAEAERASHLKTRLLANVSHELRTPLNVILGYSQTVLSTLQEQTARMDANRSAFITGDVEQIQRSGEHLLRLINDLLDLSQAEIGALDLYPQLVEPAPFLREVFQGMERSVGQGSAVEWRLQLPHALPAIQADPVRLRQIVLNVLSNAARFTQRGNISLGAGVDAAGEHLHIWVEDTGQGISQEQQARIFDAFSAAAMQEPQLTATRAGIGLGLSVTHHLVRLHSGRMELESWPGAGTVVHLYLPLPDPEDALAERLAAAADMVDDMAPLEATLAGLFHQAGELVCNTAAYLREHYTENLSRQQVADVMGVSPNYVSRVFRQETGLSPWQYLSRYRIAQAQKLLSTTDHTVTEIAGLVGYNDPAYFSRVFQKSCGQSPLQYRKSTN